MGCRSTCAWMLATLVALAAAARAQSLRELLDARLDPERISAPRFSPDGSRVVVSVHDDATGGEELWLVDRDGHRVLLSNGAQNRTATWTPDGSMLLFTSDRSGVFNVHHARGYDVARFRWDPSAWQGC